MNNVDKVAFILWLEGWGDGLDLADIKRLYLKWKDEWMPARTEIHFGDCTNAPCPCIRCRLDMLYYEAQLVIEVLDEQK